MSTKRLEDLERLSKELKEKKNELYECSKKLVDAVIAGEISSELDIQELKDTLIDLGEEERIWRQCERLYIYLIDHYPQIMDKIEKAHAKWLKNRDTMREEYDIESLNPRPNPYTTKNKSVYKEAATEEE